MKRRRPPSSTREIGAYLCGWRLARYWSAEHGGQPPERGWLLENMAKQDQLVYCSLGPRKYWYFFDQGWAAGLVDSDAQ